MRSLEDQIDPSENDELLCVAQRLFHKFLHLCLVVPRPEKPNFVIRAELLYIDSGETKTGIVPTYTSDENRTYHGNDAGFVPHTASLIDHSNSTFLTQYQKPTALF